MKRRRVLQHVAAMPVVAGIGQSSALEQKWNMPFADAQNTGYAPLDVARGRLGVAWRASFDDRLFADSTTYDGTAYLGLEDGQIIEIDTETGTHRTLTSLPAQPGWSITTGRDRLYLTAYDDMIYAVSRTNGSIEWHRPISTTQGSPPTLHGGEVFVGRSDGTLYSFESNTGASQWRASLPGPIEWPPAVTDGVVVAREDSGVTVAFERDSGDELWRFESEADTLAQAIGSPVISDGRVYVEGEIPEAQEDIARQVVALDLDSGEEIWRGKRLRGSLVHLIARPDAIVFSSHRDLRAVDPATGDEIWSRSEDDPKTHLASVNDAIYAVDDEVRVIDPADGNVRTRFSPSLSSDSNYLSPRSPIPGGLLLETSSEILAVTDAAADSRDSFPWKLIGGAGAASLLGGGALLWHQLQKRSGVPDTPPSNDAD